MRLLGRHPKLAMLFVGFVSSFLLIVAAEFALRLHAKWGSMVPSTVFSPPLEFEEPVGCRPRADCLLVAETKDSKETLYRYEAHIDQYHRRITHCTDVPRNGQFALFFGCSFTFGQGVCDEETLPSRFCNRVPGVEVENYACGGYGVQQMYCLLSRSNEIRGELQASTGLALYVYIDHHLDRLRGTVPWAAYTPHLEVEDGRVVYKGSFAAHTPLERADEWLKSYQVGRLIQKVFQPDEPPSLHDQDKLARVCAASKEKVQALFPGSDLKVIIFPYAVTAVSIKALLEKYGVDCLDYHDLLNTSGLSRDEMVFSDAHPRAKTIEIIADRLATDLAADPAWGPRLGLAP
jgi:hypothetical protein